MKWKFFFRSHILNMWVILIALEVQSDDYSNNTFNSNHRNLPCSFHDSVNISSGTIDQNESITFEGTTFCKDQYYLIDYSMMDGIRTMELSHNRSCLCHSKNCVRLCYQKALRKNYTTNVLDENNEAKLTELRKQFDLIYEETCSISKQFHPDDFQLTHEGRLLYRDTLYTHHEYCLQLKIDEMGELVLDAKICYEESGQIDYLRYIITASGMLISVPFIIATFSVYIIIPELRNLHGKCLLCYLVSLLMIYTLLAVVQLHTEIGELSCKSVAYAIYFAFISAFLWSSVISANVWSHFGTTVKFNLSSDKKQFLAYLAYGWGLSLLLTLFAYVVDSKSSIPNHFKPGLGTKTCFMEKGSTVSHLIYFFLPLCMTFILNIGFFIATAMKINQVQNELKQIASNQKSIKHRHSFDKDKHNFIIYLRLLIVMGLNWITDGIALLVDPTSYFFLVSDLCNALQGLFIFVLFVLKSNVIHMIKKRLQGSTSNNISIAPTLDEQTMLSDLFIL